MGPTQSSIAHSAHSTLQPSNATEDPTDKAAFEETADTAADEDHGTESDDDDESDSQFEGLEMSGSKPGVFPFTTVSFDNQFVHDIYDVCLVSGWLHRKQSFERRTILRWCALYDNYIYEFENELGEMVLKEKINLNGCICYEDESSPNTFVVYTGGLYVPIRAGVVENKIFYRYDGTDEFMIDDWIKGISMAPVLSDIIDNSVAPSSNQLLDADEQTPKISAEIGFFDRQSSIDASIGSKLSSQNSKSRQMMDEGRTSGIALISELADVKTKSSPGDGAKPTISSVLPAPHSSIKDTGVHRKIDDEQSNEVDETLVPSQQPDTNASAPNTFEQNETATTSAKEANVDEKKSRRSAKWLARHGSGASNDSPQRQSEK